MVDTYSHTSRSTLPPNLHSCNLITLPSFSRDLMKTTAPTLATVYAIQEQLTLGQSAVQQPPAPRYRKADDEETGLHARLSKTVYYRLEKLLRRQLCTEQLPLWQVAQRGCQICRKCVLSPQQTRIATVRGQWQADLGVPGDGA